MDKIIMTGLEFYGYHGMSTQEQELGQRFQVDAELFLELKKAGETDAPEHTVDYSKAAQVIKSVIEGPPCKLIEAVAEKVATGLLELCPVRGVMIRIKKTQAPLPIKFESMAVEIWRKHG
ncbi:MAG: dihydroneopterin aldolase [Peptococcaceae bacterium]|nr:dihydroneopterin aldolase [Peptococcaceae bacterium]